MAILLNSNSIAFVGFIQTSISFQHNSHNLSFHSEPETLNTVQAPSYLHIKSIISDLARLHCVVFPRLVVDKHERDKHNESANPVPTAGILRTQHDLADQREWDAHGKTHGHDERGGEEHGVGPAVVTDEGG